MFQPLFNFPVGTSVEFPGDSEVFKIIKWEYITCVQNVRDVQVVLLGGSGTYYAHPLNRVREVKV